MSETCPMCWTEHDYDSACPTVKNPPNDIDSKVFLASYSASCALCMGHIAPGAPVGYMRILKLGHDALVHERCPA